MDTKLTLHFDKEIISQAKDFAAKNNVSLSRLTEFLYRQITSGGYKNLEELPISDWVMKVAEGEATYRKRGSKTLKEEFFKSKR